MEDLRDKSQAFMGRFHENDAIRTALLADAAGHISCDGLDVGSLSGSASAANLPASVELSDGTPQYIGIPKGKKFSVFATSSAWAGTTLEVQYALDGGFFVYESGPTGTYTANDDRGFIQGGDLDVVRVLLTAGSGPVSVSVNIIP